MPIDEGALLDTRPTTWLVCPPGRSHKPAVSQGPCLVLYLLPQGSIERTRD